MSKEHLTFVDANEKEFYADAKMTLSNKRLYYDTTVIELESIYSIRYNFARNRKILLPNIIAGTLFTLISIVFIILLNINLDQSIIIAISLGLTMAAIVSITCWTNLYKECKKENNAGIKIFTETNY
ncbi:MAG: hypothetical protein LBS99_01175 [Clostridiales bacterium]|jgi:hypothetical protein|nr:hypothetical protein [Clostridiales bacterium]